MSRGIITRKIIKQFNLGFGSNSSLLDLAPPCPHCESMRRLIKALSHWIFRRVKLGTTYGTAYAKPALEIYLRSFLLGSHRGQWHWHFVKIPQANYFFCCYQNETVDDIFKEKLLVFVVGICLLPFTNVVIFLERRPQTSAAIETIKS